MTDSGALALGGLLVDAQELLGRRVEGVTEASLHPALRERRCLLRPAFGDGRIHAAGQELPVASGSYWLGNNCLRPAVHVSASPNLVGQVQTTFAEWTMLKKGQRSTPCQCIEGPLGRTCEQRMNDKVNLVNQTGIQQATGQLGAAHEVDVLA